MSAPPMGRVTPMPSRVEAATNNHSGPAAGPASGAAAAMNTPPTREARARVMFTAWRTELWVQPGVPIQPCSLPMATIEPLKVIAPTNTEITIEMRSTRVVSLGSNSATARATSSEAMPPQPLNRATVSGMAVIGTRWAVSRPNRPPAAVPTAIHSQAVGLGCT